jgi:hypothetical protein
MFPTTGLAKIDVATTAHGLESRSPFLDHELTALAALAATMSKRQIVPALLNVIGGFVDNAN